MDIIWIPLNENIIKLSISELTTLIDTLYLISQAGCSLTREQLKEMTGKKVDTISKHLKKAEQLEIIKKINKKYYIVNTGEVRSAATEYIPLNSTFLVRVDSLVDDQFSYSLQAIFGKQHSDYYNGKYEMVDIITKGFDPNDITIKYAGDIEFNGVVYTYYNNND